MRANKSFGRAKIGGDASGSHGSDIVKAKRDRNRAKKIVKANTIRDTSSRGLESQMDVGNTVPAGYGGGIPDASYGTLINGPAKMP